MTKNEIEIIKKIKRWPFKIYDVFDRYFFIIFPLAIFFVSISVTKSGFMNELNNLKLMGIIGALLSLAFLTFVIKRLHENQVFKLYKTENLNLEKIEEALKKCGFENFEYYKCGYYEVQTKISWFSWGETITIIPNQSEILINSKPNGTRFKSQPITINKDRKNIKKLIEELNKP